MQSEVPVHWPHRLRFSVRTMCWLLHVHPSGFYAWLKNPSRKRASEDKRQTDLLFQAWEESGEVYEYRKLHDDLLDQGEMCCPNRVARVTRLAGIKVEVVTSVVLANLAAGLPSLSTIRSTGNLTSRLRTRHGSRTSPIFGPSKASPISR